MPGENSVSFTWDKECSILLMSYRESLATLVSCGIRPVSSVSCSVLPKKGSVSLMLPKEDNVS